MTDPALDGLRRARAMTDRATGQPRRPDDRSQRLAVYGTLAPGAPNAHVLADLAGQWRRGTVRGTRHEDGWHGYPGLILAGDDEVPVAVLHAPGLVDEWDAIDAFEGPGYRRATVLVTLDDGARVPAQVYVLAGRPTGR